MDKASFPKRRISLTTWIFGLVLLPILVAGAWALIALALHPDNENDQVAARSLTRLAPALEQELTLEGERLQRLGALIAKDPKFFAVLNLPKTDRARPDFRNALENVMREFQRDVDAPIFEAMDDQGILLARALKPATEMADLSVAPYVRAAIAGRTGQGYLIEKGKVYRVATVPVTAGGPIVGVLCLGWEVDADLAEQLKGTIGCDIAFTVSDEVQVTTLTPSPLRKILAQRVDERSLAGSRDRGAKGGVAALSAKDVDVIAADGERYVALRRALQGPSVGGELAYVLIRPLTLQSSPIAAIRSELLWAVGSGLFLALVAGATIAVMVHRRRRSAEAAHEVEVKHLTDIDRMRTGFITSASAEVLEPATTIRTIIDLIEEGALGELTGPQLEGLLSLRNSAEALTRIGTDLANLSLLDRNELPLEFDATDMGNLVEHAAIGVMPMASERKQSVTISVEPQLVHPRVDAWHLSKAILNLALNAVRFSPDGGTIEVEARRIGRGIGVFVSDSGMSHPEADHGMLPGPDSERAGIGLAVAVGIVEAHGGTLKFWSESGSGNTFAIELPFTGESATVTPEEALPLAS